jgi:4-hydroxybenzoate polyprenyltransferase
VLDLPRGRLDRRRGRDRDRRRVAFDPWIAAFVAAGAFIVVAYNPRVLRRSLPRRCLFALAWGSFPLLTAYFATAESIGAAAIAGAVFAYALSLAQRVLSTQVRDLRAA